MCAMSILCIFCDVGCHVCVSCIYYAVRERLCLLFGFVAMIMWLNIVCISAIARRRRATILEFSCNDECSIFVSY